MKKFTNKVAVITGGTSGIGLATAMEFAREGAKVVVFARNEDNLKQALQQIGENSHGVQGDVTNTKDLDRLYAETTSIFGKIDILVINAAQIKLAPIEETTEALFDEMIGVNFKGGYFTLQRSLPHLNTNASVVILTSYLNSVGFAGSSLLSGSKAALRSLVRVASAELASRGIRVNAVSPGAIVTPLWGKIGLPEEVLKAAGEAITNQIPIKRWGHAEEVAKAILFLASQDSSYIVGNELAVDGGLRQI